MTELEKCECVLSVMTITPILKIEEKTMGTMGILLVVYDGVYVCICKVYYSVLQSYKQHAFVYDNNFSQLEKSDLCGAIIDNRSYAPIYVPEEKDRKSNTALKNMLRKLFEVTFIVVYAFKVTTDDFSLHIVDLC